MSGDPRAPGTPGSVRTGRRYRPGRLAEDYDTIVVGSGIGGLTAAACLSRLGQRVLVLEQHYTAGGFTHSYVREGYEWDVGVHYLGEVGRPGTLARRLLDYIGDGSLSWAPLDAAFDRIFLGPHEFRLVAGREAYRQALVDQFPGEEAVIDSYLGRLREVRGWARRLVLEKLLPEPVTAALQRLRPPPAWVNGTTREVLESLTDNQLLIAVLTAQWGDLGLPPARSSFIAHSLVAQHYMGGAYYPVGGASRMAASIIPVIRAGGGEVFTYAPVAEIALERGRAVGVTMADGTLIRAPRVISNAGVLNTFGPLLPAAERVRYRERLAAVRPAMASMCLYLGLRGTAAELGLPRSNFWIYPSEHYEDDLEHFEHQPGAPLPLIYISFPSAKDPSFEERYPGRATIEIVAPGPHAWFSSWADTPWGRRGPAYEALKEQLSQRLLEALYGKLPRLRGRVEYYELSTALSTAHFTRYASGEIYGLDHDPQRFAQRWLRPRTEIPGLYLAGQDVLTCGVVGAMVGGLLAAVAAGGLRGLALGRRLLAPGRSGGRPAARR